MKKLLVILMVATFVLGMTAVALAIDPVPENAAVGNYSPADNPFTFTESNGEGSIPQRSVGPMDNTAAGVYGNSAWNYNDRFDSVYPYASDTAKFEGSYRRFDTTVNAAALTLPNGTTIGGTGVRNQALDGSGNAAPGTGANSALDADVGLYLGGASGPHGGYSAGSNKCKTCHAVHRANGAFKLLRVDSPEDACDYCHIGSHRHSLRGAYFRGEGTKWATNGHTIGAKKTIPDSSVEQWLEAKTLTGGNDEPEERMVIKVRRYDSRRMKIMKWANRSGTWRRMGPTYLYCMTCHSVHNASLLIWKPDGTNGYKLLKASPSGSTSSITAQRNYLMLSATWDYRIKAVERSLSAFNTGPTNDLGAGTDPVLGAWNGPYTIYTQWKDASIDMNTGTKGMTGWCADCHNLNIGGAETHEEPNFSPGWVTTAEVRYYSDRTHPVRGPGCESCHLGDLVAASPPQSSCWAGHCHRGFDDYTFYSDWPHSAATWSTKLLGDEYETDGVDHNGDGTAGSGEHIDQICLRCHGYVGVGQ